MDGAPVGIDVCGEVDGVEVGPAVMNVSQRKVEHKDRLLETETSS